MKIFIKIFVICLLIVSCSETESVTFDPNSGQTGIGFEQSRVDATVPIGGVTLTIPVTSTTVSSEARTFNVIADPELTTVNAADYSLGMITIPANSFVGSLSVTLNYDGLTDFVENTLVLNMDLPDGTIGFSSVTITFLREFDISTFVCTDLTFNIVTDNFASETTWEITDAGGNVVQSGGPYSDGTANLSINTAVSLTEGCYTITIFDSFGDGLFDGNTTGTYNLFCTAQTVVSYASGSGNFGSSESTDFCIVE